MKYFLFLFQPTLIFFLLVVSYAIKLLLLRGGWESERTSANKKSVMSVSRCHSYKGKIVKLIARRCRFTDKRHQNNKALNRKTAKCYKFFFLLSVDWGPAAYASKAKIWPKPWCPFPTLLAPEPRVKSRVRKRPLPDKTKGEITLSKSIYLEMNLVGNKL